MEKVGKTDKRKIKTVKKQKKRKNKTKSGKD